jgi:hypothetical protein
MPIPEFDERGLLPPGVHDCSLDEIGARFGTFRGSDRRPRLFGKLEQYVLETQQTGLVVALVINGSFVTATPQPNDIDLIVLLQPGHDFSAELRPFEYNVLSSRWARKRYGLDVMVATEGSAAAERYYRLFRRVRGRPDASKGLLRLELPAPRAPTRAS